MVKSPEVMSKRKLSVLVVPASDSEPELEVRGVWKSLVAFFGRDGGGLTPFKGVVAIATLPNAFPTRPPPPGARPHRSASRVPNCSRHSRATFLIVLPVAVFQRVGGDPHIETMETGGRSAKQSRSAARRPPTAR